MFGVESTLGSCQNGQNNIFVHSVEANYPSFNEKKNKY